MTETREKISPELFTAKQASEYLGVSVPLLKLWRLEKTGPPVKKFTDGKTARCRYWRADLDAWIAQLSTEQPLPEGPPPRVRDRSRKS
jgi:hypothetical protein